MKSMTKSLWTAVGIGLVVLAAGLRTLAIPAVAAEPFVAYLPIVVRSPSLLYGYVTQGGAHAVGVGVTLRFYDGAQWSNQAVENTDATGEYQFVGQPPLTAGQAYQVAFENTSNDDNRLAAWSTRQVMSFGDQSVVEIGDFDIAAISLTDPATNITLGLPGTFRWTRRPATPSDNYALRLYDTTDFNPLFVSPYQGYADQFTLDSLPSGFQEGVGYTWDVILLAGDGATGVSRQARTVRLASGIHGKVTLNGTPAGGVDLQLRFFDGSAWTTRATATTSAGGAYGFANMPGLSAGQEYYVRFENVQQTPGRLFVWGTAPLTAYGASAAIDLGSFDIGDVSLSSPAGGASLDMPVTFQWARRTTDPQDTYILEIYDPSDYQPRWLSPLLGYADHYDVLGLSDLLATGTNYAWDVIITSPDGGSGVSGLARLVQFNNRGDQNFRVTSAEWPFEEELPPRPLAAFSSHE